MLTFWMPILTASATSSSGLPDPPWSTSGTSTTPLIAESTSMRSRGVTPLG